MEQNENKRIHRRPNERLFFLVSNRCIGMIPFKHYISIEDILSITPGNTIIWVHTIEGVYFTNGSICIKNKRVYGDFIKQ